MIQSIQEDVYRLYGNMTPNYIRDFEQLQTLVSVGSYNLSPMDTKGQPHIKH